jgi:hypothetical protein
MEKYFDIVVNENDETGFDFNSLVMNPAHELPKIAFNKQVPIKQHFNDEKRIVTGVAIAANKWIFRNDEINGEHYVRFTPPVIELMNIKNAKANNFNLVNIEHDPKQVAKGVYLIANYIVSNKDPKYPNVPDAFKDQSIDDGSLIRSYYFENKELYDKVKKEGGFSIEGWFDKKKVNFKQSNKMSKQKKTIFQLLFGEEDKKTFAQVTAVDGTVLMYDGELAEKTAMFIDENGEQVAAKAGDYQVTLEDGTEKVVTIDEAGLVSAIMDVQAMDNDDDASNVEAQVAELMKKVLKDTDERFKAIEAENKTLKAEIGAFKSQFEAIAKGGKFESQGKKAGAEPTKKTALDLINNK